MELAVAAVSRTYRPAAGLVPSVMARPSVPPLDAARLRLRQRFQSKFPVIAKQPPRVQEAVPPSSKNMDHLEAARLRVRNRFHDKFPVAASMDNHVSMPESFHRSDLQAPTPPDTQNDALESARLRLRERFTHKFLPDFRAFPTSVDAAVEAMQDSHEWGSHHAVVITSAKAPYPILKVNKAWEELCGYSQNEVVGQTFATLNISGSYTDPDTKIALAKTLEHRERAAFTLTNKTKDGKMFKNYLRVAPLTDEADSNVITHFIGVLQDDDDTHRHKVKMVM